MELVFFAPRVKAEFSEFAVVFVAVAKLRLASRHISTRNVVLFIGTSSG